MKYDLDLRTSCGQLVDSWSLLSSLGPSMQVGLLCLLIWSNPFWGNGIFRKKKMFISRRYDAWVWCLEARAGSLEGRHQWISCQELEYFASGGKTFKTYQNILPLREKVTKYFVIEGTHNKNISINILWRICEIFYIGVVVQKCFVNFTKHQVF